MRKPRRLVPVVTAGLLMLMGATALAGSLQDSGMGAASAVKAPASAFIEEKVTVSNRKPQGDVSLLATVRTVTITRTFKSLAGLTVARHDSTTTWTYGGGYLYSSPRAISVDWWTAPLNNYKSHSATWDWFTPGQGGTGRSNTQVVFVFGVPTPWGPVGSSYSSRIHTTVNGNGGYSYF